MKKLFVLLVVFSMAFAFKSEARPIKFSIDIKFGEPDSKGGCNSGFGICSIIISLRTAPNSGGTGSEVMEVQGEIANNMLVIHLPKGIQENGRNKQGGYTFTLRKEMLLEQDLAKELGVEKLIIAPGNYEIRGNTLALKIVSPRDISTGQSSGKRLLPTVNK